MNTTDYILIGLIILGLAGSLIVIIRKKRQGTSGCCGDCTACHQCSNPLYRDEVDKNNRGKD